VRISIALLSCLLFLQLSGLTCIQDAWASSFSGSGTDLVTAGNLSSEPTHASGDAESNLHHDCPCHHLTSLSTLTTDSVTAPGAPIAPVSFSAPSDLPQVLFHPPLALL